MYTFGLILIAFVVGPSFAHPVGYGLLPNSPYDYINYSPCVGDLCRNLFPLSGGVYPSNVLGGVLGGDVLPGVPLDVGINYPYGSPRTVNFAKENYVRDYGYGQAEVGIRDQVSVRSNVPGIGIIPPYSRVCSYLPIGTCLRGVNRYPALPVEYDVAY